MKLRSTTGEKNKGEGKERGRREADEGSREERETRKDATDQLVLLFSSEPRKRR